jgi:hypothetical protein
MSGLMSNMTWDKVTVHNKTSAFYLWFRCTGKVLFYARVTLVKTSHKPKTKFPFKTVYFLGVRVLTTLSFTVYDYITSKHMDL